MHIVKIKSACPGWICDDSATKNGVFEVPRILGTRQPLALTAI